MKKIFVFFCVFVSIFLSAYTPPIFTEDMLGIYPIDTTKPLVLRYLSAPDANGITLKDSSNNIFAVLGKNGNAFDVMNSITSPCVNSYVQNCGFEIGIVGVSTSDATDLAISHDTSTPITGAGSLKIVKAASNQNGECVTVAVKAFDASDYDPDFGGPAILEARFSLSNSTGFVDEDLTFVPYCETTSSNIVTSNGAIAIESNQARSYKFQVPSTCLQMSAKLCVANTNTNGFTVLVDDFVIDKQVGASGSVDTDFEDITIYANANLIPTGLGTGSGTYSYYKIKKQGEIILINFMFTKDAQAGTGVSTVYFPLPHALKYSENELFNIGRFSSYGVTHTDPAVTTGFVSGAAFINPSVPSASMILTKSGVAGYITGGDVAASGNFRFKISYPVLGWESNNKISTPYSNREISSRYSNTAQTFNNATATQVTWSTTDYENTPMTTDKSTFTALESGRYFVNPQIRFNPNAASVAVYVTIEIWKTPLGGSAALYAAGTISTTSNSIAYAYEAKVPTTIDLNRGDSFYIKVTQGNGNTSNLTVSGGAVSNFIDIYKINSGSQRFAKEEKVIVEYTGNGGTTIVADTTNIDFANKVEDSHGSWDGTTFTAKSNRRFRFNARALFTDLQARALRLYKNGVVTRIGVSVTTDGPGIETSLSLNIEDTITFRCGGTAGTLSDNDIAHWLTITSED